MDINSSKRRKVDAHVKGALDELRALDDMVCDLEEPGTKPETPSVAQMRE